MRLFTDRKINTRITLGFASILAIVATISIVAYVVLARIESGFESASSRVTVANIARDIDREFVSFRRYALLFSMNGGEQDAKQALERGQRVAATIADGSKHIRNPERLAKLKAVQEQFAVYAKDFDKLVHLRREQDKLTRDVLDPNGATLRKSLEQLQAITAQSNPAVAMLAIDANKQLMLARLGVNKVLGRHDQAAAKTAETAFTAFDDLVQKLEALPADDTVRALVGQIRKTGTTYISAAHTAIHDAHVIEELFNGEMLRAGQEIDVAARAIRDSATADQRQIQHETADVIATSSRAVLAIALCGMAFGAFLSWLIGRGISRPVQSMTQVMTSLAHGDLRVEIPALGNKDELGDMARAVVVFRDAAIDKIRMEKEAEAARIRSEQERREAQERAIAEERELVSKSIGAGMAKLAAKDLTFRLTDTMPAAYAKLQSDFNSALAALEDALQGVQASAETISLSTSEVTVSADDLSRRTEQQAASLEETAAALDEITATGKKAAEGAVQARDVVSTAKADAERTGNVVRKTVDAMGNIARSAQQINQIIGVIDEIAFQTNLLALNAGVEAARAGEAGRGFAVVASEVRALAQRSAEAAKEIKSLISTSTAQVDEGVELVAETGQALERILGQVNDINAVVLDIAAGAQEQSTGLNQVNVAINQMDQTTQQNAAMVEETTAASHSLAQEARQLAELVGSFRLNASGPRRVATVVAHPAKSPRPQAKQTVRASSRAVAAAAVKPVENAADTEWKDF